MLCCRSVLAPVARRSERRVAASCDASSWDGKPAAASSSGFLPDGQPSKAVAGSGTVCTVAALLPEHKVPAEGASIRVEVLVAKNHKDKQPLGGTRITCAGSVIQHPVIAGGSRLPHARGSARRGCDFTAPVYPMNVLRTTVSRAWIPTCLNDTYANFAQASWNFNVSHTQVASLCCWTFCGHSLSIG